jgi:hypothetical protein
MRDASETTSIKRLARARPSPEARARAVPAPSSPCALDACADFVCACSRGVSESPGEPDDIDAVGLGVEAARRSASGGETCGDSSP